MGHHVVLSEGRDTYSAYENFLEKREKAHRKMFFEIITHA
jgi:hypothetical protein